MLAVVTGASRGIGRATALALARRQLDVALLGRPSPELDESRTLCRELGVEAEVYGCDVAQTESIEDAARSVLEWDTPCALINNAGAVERSMLAELSLDSYHRQMNTNLLGPIWLTKQLLPAMRAARRGRIVNVASISSTLGTAGQIAYNASKWAVVGFTKSLAEELRGSGLMTVAVLPGSVDTRMLAGSGFAPQMTPEDVAKTLTHYSLDASLAHNGASVEMFG